MSYIDTFNHEIVGNLNGLPIYHPLEVVKGSYPEDFDCTPQNLVLGGGAGEHPGLVIHHLGSLAASYLLFCIEKDQDFRGAMAYGLPKETIKKVRDIAYGNGNRLTFHEWSMRHHSDFVERAKSSLHGRPLEDKQSAEAWIFLSIGEFVWFSLPELNEKLDEIMSLPGIAGWDMGINMGNVTCPPPNYIKSKMTSMKGTPSFRERGFFRWDFAYPPKAD